MKKLILKLSLGVATMAFALNSYAQCPSIVCPNNITVNNDTGGCGAVVTFTTPNGIDACATGSQTFNYTGSLQTFTVPSGVTSIDFDVIGASGGNNSTALGGGGGRVQGTINVTPGDLLNIYVGKQGINSLNEPVDPFTGGGGVYSYSSCGLAGTGGGASDIRLNGTNLTDRIVVAGGGGGAGGTTGSSAYAGGNGGGLAGAAGTPWSSWPNSGGKGGTASAGGDAGVACCSCPTYTSAGQLGVGGNGSGDCAGGGGGGSGYYGGGGSCFGGAGGGSSYTDASATSVIHTQGFQTGNGQVIISYLGASVTTTQITGLASGATFPVGTTINTYSATNAFGTDTCSFTVTVVDAEAPTITCPTNITVNNDAGMCHAVVTYTAPVGTDNCTGATTALTAGLGSGATFPVGTTTETYEVTDAANNTFSCSFTVTVVDAETPTITCPASVSSCNATVNNIAPTTTDNCTGETVTYSLTGATVGSGVTDASGTLFNQGITTVQYIVTDVVGNQDSCSFDVTVNPLPTVTIAAFTPDTICESGPAVDLPVGTPASGIYSGSGVSGSTFDPSIDGVGSHYVVYTFTDANSCTNSDSTMIVVVSCVGISENGALSGITVFPNPTANVINVSLGEVTTKVNVTITSIDGKVVYRLNNVTDKFTSINISNISTGIYFLHIGNDKDYNVYKVIKN